MRAAPERPGDDGRFLHHQRHHVVLAVDQEVESQPHGKTEDAHDVLDHLVCHRQAQRVIGGCQGANVFLRSGGRAPAVR